MAIKHILEREKARLGGQFPFFVRLLLDTVLSAICMYSVVRFRYFQWRNPVKADIDIKAALIFASCVFIISLVLRTHKAIWRFASFGDMVRLFNVLVLSSLFTAILLFMFFDRSFGLPRSAPVLVVLVAFIVLSGLRVIVAFIKNGNLKGLFLREKLIGPIAIIVGSAPAIHKFIKETKQSPKSSTYRPVAAITPNQKFYKNYIGGVPVMGGLSSIPDIFQALSVKYGTPPSIIDIETRKTRRMYETYEIVREASRVGARVFRLEPGRNDVFTPLEISDLIERTPREMQTQPVHDFLKGKRILLTGAGGSIGSELMRHILRSEPKRLAMIDMSELALFNIRQEILDSKTPYNPEMWKTYLGNILDKNRMSEIFQLEKPEIVIHAAALKHVIFGEENPLETLRTNILGTQIIHDLSLTHEVESFSLISTDKACKPTSIMGASKRVAELIVLSNRKGKQKTSSCAVRFGNVFVSTGSVVHIFQQQIENGGPVTVTHPDVKRYFMTTREATALVLQASAYNLSFDHDTANIYTLEMGESVKIIDLARKLIRLKGLVPEKDIDIVYTGLVSGEKLAEDLFERVEQCVPTDIDGILNYQDEGLSSFQTTPHIKDLLKFLDSKDIEKVEGILCTMFPLLLDQKHITLK